MQTYPTKAAFRETLNSTWRLHNGAGVAGDLELIEVSEGRSTPRNEQFALLFRAAPDAPAAQGLYRLEHEQLGAFDVFLVPVGRDGAGLYYEAVFNRLIDGQLTIGSGRRAVSRA